MATGTTVANLIPVDPSAKTDANSLNAINFAIAASWPNFKMATRTSGGTLASGTFEYSLATLTLLSRELGVAHVDIAEDTTSPKTRHRQYYQFFDSTTGAWTLVVSKAIASDYSTKTFYCTYQYAHPQLTALTETVYLPLGYAIQAASLYYEHLIASAQLSDSTFHRALAPEFYRAQVLAQSIFVPQLPTLSAYGRERMP